MNTLKIYCKNIVNVSFLKWNKLPTDSSFVVNSWLCLLDYRVDSSVNWRCTMWTYSLIGQSWPCFWDIRTWVGLQLYYCMHFGFSLFISPSTVLFHSKFSFSKCGGWLYLTGLILSINLFLLLFRDFIIFLVLFMNYFN